MSDNIGRVCPWIHISTTNGWHPPELIEGGSDCDETDAETNNDANVEGNEVVWIEDDRLDPIYMRADPEYSLKECNELDKILKHHLPELKNRRRHRRRRTTSSSGTNLSFWLQSKL